MLILADTPAALLNIHTAFVPIILAAGGATLLCGLVLIVMSRGGALASSGLQRVFRVLLMITAGLGVLQALLGITLVATGANPGDQLHYVYGGIVLLAIPVAYVYSDQKAVRRDIIIMTIAAVAIIGAAIRAFMTGAPH
ncbi:MAG TPA: hypothetical protein VFY89_03775 [Ktedonobacterales bacterium]